MADRPTTMERFDKARVQFVDAINGAPTESLTFMVAGDDYALGGLVTHVNAVLVRYGDILRGIVADPEAELDATEIDVTMARTNATATAGLSAAERESAMATLARLHDGVLDTLAGVDDADWERESPVRYGGGDPFPSSPEMITAWLTDHYREHVPHVAALLDEWQRR